MARSVAFASTYVTTRVGRRDLHRPAETLPAEHGPVVRALPRERASAVRLSRLRPVSLGWGHSPVAFA